VEGDIEAIEGVLRITRIRVFYRARIPSGTREKAERVLETHAAMCPAYQSVKGCIDVSWEAELDEESP
jgi:hypothetical protein